MNLVYEVHVDTKKFTMIYYAKINEFLSAFVHRLSGLKFVDKQSSPVKLRNDKLML
jgi:hypothetical protein